MKLQNKITLVNSTNPHKFLLCDFWIYTPYFTLSDIQFSRQYRVRPFDYDDKNHALYGKKATQFLIDLTLKIYRHII